MVQEVRTHPRGVVIRMPEAVRDSLQVHPAGLALRFVDRTAARVGCRISVGYAQAIEERFAVGNVCVERCLTVVVVQTPRGFRLDFACLDQLVESRRRFRNRALTDRVGVGGLNR